MRFKRYSTVIHYIYNREKRTHIGAFDRKQVALIIVRGDFECHYRMYYLQLLIYTKCNSRDSQIVTFH